jgi:hypothetical protein
MAGLLGDVMHVRVEHDALLARERDKVLASNEMSIT